MPSNHIHEHKSQEQFDHHFSVKWQRHFAQCVKKQPQPHVTSDWSLENS